MTPKWPRGIREVRSGLPQRPAAPQPEPQSQPDAAPSEPAAPPASPEQEIQELAAMAEALLAQAAELRRQTQELAAELAGEKDREPVSGMRIVAVNMAAAGRSREEAVHYLREHFGESPDPALLDEVFGDPGDEPGRD